MCTMAQQHTQLVMFITVFCYKLQLFAWHRSPYALVYMVATNNAVFLMSGFALAIIICCTYGIATDAVTITRTDIVGVVIGWSQFLCLSFSVSWFDKFAGKCPANNHIYYFTLIRGKSQSIPDSTPFTLKCATSVEPCYHAVPFD